MPYHGRMRVGISLSSSHPGDDHRAGPHNMVERARAARHAGLDLLCVGDHHATGPMPYVQNTPVMGRLLSEWPDRQAGCLFLVPAWHPVLMAEQIGTLAAMASGPFVVQTGLGAPDQVAALGVHRSDRPRRLEDGIDLVKALLAGDEVTDERFNIDGVRIAPLPPDGVEWWIGGSAEVSMRRAARKGDGWYCDAGVDADAAATQMQMYVDGCESVGREPGRTAIRKDVFISENADHARSVGDDLIAAGYRGMQRGAVAYGDPDEVAEQLSVFADLGFTDVVIRMMSVAQDQAVASIELAGRVRELLS